MAGKTPSTLSTSSSDPDILSGIQKNARARESFWAVTFRKPSHSARVSTESRPAPPARTSTSLDLAVRPPSPPHTLCHALDAPASIPLLPLDPHLQAYFLKMQSTATDTCHPREIAAAARRVVAAILARQTAPGTLAHAAAWGEALVRAGVARREYSRTVAVVVHDVVAALLWASWAQNRAFERAVVARATQACAARWTADDGAPDDARAQMLDAAAFVGDLFALGVLRARDMCALVAPLVDDARSATHCRALHLLLLRAQAHIGEDLPAEFLCECRQKLVWQATHARPFVEDDMARRWLIEICNVIERTLTQRGLVTTFGRSPACHHWDTHLSIDVVSGLLDAPPNADVANV
ncbi:hypothetical protein B0H21DRAFT_821387 [Amylocystis lapponica]|nr:hypothetical protein B0H21DRAFT_821387 [Amylocystis lapponica]